MAIKKVLNPINFLINSTIDAVDSASIALGAKSDGLYVKKYHATTPVDEKILTSIGGGFTRLNGSDKSGLNFNVATTHAPALEFTASDASVRGSIKLGDVNTYDSLTFSTYDSLGFADRLKLNSQKLASYVPLEITSANDSNFYGLTILAPNITGVKGVGFSFGKNLAQGRGGNLGYLSNAVSSFDGTYLCNYGDSETTAGVFIKKGGNVGIGTGDPQSKLEVSGNILSTSITSTSQILGSYIEKTLTSSLIIPVTANSNVDIIIPNSAISGWFEIEVTSTVYGSIIKRFITNVSGGSLTPLSVDYLTIDSLGDYLSIGNLSYSAPNYVVTVSSKSTSAVIVSIIIRSNSGSTGQSIANSAYLGTVYQSGSNSYKLPISSFQKKQRVIQYPSTHTEIDAISTIDYTYTSRYVNYTSVNASVTTINVHTSLSNAWDIIYNKKGNMYIGNQTGSTLTFILPTSPIVYDSVTYIPIIKEGGSSISLPHGKWLYIEHEVVPIASSSAIIVFTYTVESSVLSTGYLPLTGGTITGSLTVTSTTSSVATFQSNVGGTQGAMLTVRSTATSNADKISGMITEAPDSTYRAGWLLYKDASQAFFLNDYGIVTGANITCYQANTNIGMSVWNTALNKTQLSLFIQSGTGRVGIKTNNPQSELHVNGSIKANKFIGSLAVIDTRYANDNPFWYYNNSPSGVMSEFKSVTSIGLFSEFPDINVSWAVVTTYVPYPDATGGYPVQIATCEPGIYRRAGTSDTSWGPWYKLNETIGAP